VRERFLVTGGAGFIGRRLCARLLDAGHFVRVVDDLSRGSEIALPDGCEWIRGSVLDPVLCREACEGIDGVFHLAAAIETPPGVEAVDFFMQQNVQGTQNVLLAARDGHVKKLVYTASRTVYGGHAPPHTTALAPDCLTPYALSKLVGEQLCALFTRLYGLPTLSLRCADVYGPGQPDSGPYATVVSALLEQRRRGRTPAPPCSVVRRDLDLLHVDDAAEACWRGYQASASGSTLDVSSGRTWSAKAVAELAQANGSSAGSAAALHPAIAATLEQIGWAPRIPLEEGLPALFAATASRKAFDG
jgi:nucleoside-diphosphate-sugar epimerase